VVTFKIGVGILCLFAGINLMGCDKFSGLFYPKIRFSFKAAGDQPPDGATERLSSGGRYPQAITFFFSQGGNTFEKYFIPTIFVNKPYKVLHLYEMSYEWEGGTGVFLSDRIFALPVEEYISQDGWYWLGSVGQDFFGINFEDIFEGKKIGDKFLFKLKLKYSFDNELRREQILRYEITVVEGRYIFPFDF
jgi:hypothetical protein